MRFERRDTATACEFWVYDVPEELHGTIEAVWWDSRRLAGWCKSFDPAAHLIDAAFANLAERFEPLLRQAADLDPVPWAEALATVCQRLVPAGIDWWLAGSAALAVRGADVSPHDLDLIVADLDSRQVGELLVDGLVEPVTRSDWHLSRWWGRAFLGARRVGGRHHGRRRPARGHRLRPHRGRAARYGPLARLGHPGTPAGSATCSVPAPRPDRPRHRHRPPRRSMTVCD